MTVGVPSAILASIVSLTVTIAITLRRPRRPLYTRFAAFTFTLFLWQGASLASRFGGDAIARLKIAAALLIVPTVLAFFAELLREHSTFIRNLTGASIVISIAGLLVVFSPWGTHFVVGGAATMYVVSAIGLVLHTLFVRARSARIESERKRLWYLLLGGLIALVLALGELLPGAELPAAMGHVAATFYVYFLYQSVLSRRVIDLVELLGKAAVLGVLTLVLATVYALLLLWVGTHEQELWLFNTLVASFVILILYDQVRPWVEATTARLLFRQRFELLRVIRRLQRDLRTTISIEEMTRQVIDAVHSSGRVNQVALYLSTEAEIEYELAGSQGVEPPQALSLRQQPTLLQELRRERRPILLETLIDRYEDQPAMITEGDPTAQRDLNRAGEAIATMRALGAQAVLPILSEDDILGVLTLGTEHPTESFSTEELAALLSLADACAVVIENSQEYERLRERDRLVAVGEMAAGIAHEIRNPLGAIKGAAQCLDTGTLPQEATEFIDVIVEETDRLSRVLGQFLEYARPYRGNPVPTDVNEVITATLRLLTPDAIPDHIVIRRNLAHDLHKVSVDPEQLKQVLINLTLNAVHAMPGGGELSVSTATSHDATGEYRGEVRGLKHVHTVISIHDTGPGIPSDDLPRVFLPFFTTKTNGTGLGLAISDRIVRNAGGRIDVTSHAGHGTTLTIRLPIATASK